MAFPQIEICARLRMKLVKSVQRSSSLMTFDTNTEQSFDFAGGKTIVAARIERNQFNNHISG